MFKWLDMIILILAPRFNIQLKEVYYRPLRQGDQLRRLHPTVDDLILRWPTRCRSGTGKHVPVCF